jgi:superfamily II DNA or RNA helicase
MADAIQLFLSSRILFYQSEIHMNIADMLPAGTKRTHTSMEGTVTTDARNTRIDIRVKHTTTDPGLDCTVCVASDRGSALPPVVPLEEDDLPPPLHPHQLYAINRVLKALGEGVQRIGVSAATGSGKTATFVSLLQYIPKRGRGQKVLILVPRLQVLDQVLQECQARLPASYRVITHRGSSQNLFKRAHV